jgi:hypothetical protein
VSLTAFAEAGDATKTAETVIVSVVRAEVLATETGTAMYTAWFVVPPKTIGVPTVAGASVALAGATEVNTPKPKAATVTSAMRLKVVFVDICFLSISRSREFLPFGLNQISLIRFDESHVLIHQIPHRVSGRGEETYF